MSDRDCNNCEHHSDGGCSVWECSFERKKDDLISRQAAIDALKEHRALFCDNTPDTFSKLSYGEKCRVDELDTAISTLVNLPSAQPTQTDTSNTLKALDCVERQAAIDAIEPTLKSILQGNSFKAINVMDKIRGLPSAQSEPQWIPVSERLPEEAYPVIVTWKNDDPASYYQFVLGKHYTGVAHYKNGKWFWYSSITEDVLMEYGRCDSEEFDEAIKVLAWMPLPEPYREEGDE